MPTGSLDVSALNRLSKSKTERTESRGHAEKLIDDDVV